MSPSRRGTDLTETIDHPFFVDSPGGPLFAVETTPSRERPHGVVVLCSGAWHGGSSLNNRVFVHLAHQLASAGFKAVRFDWHGCGESSGHVDRFELGAPCVAEVEAMIDHAQSEERLPLYLVGNCFGALSALPPAVDRPEVRAVVLISLPIVVQAGARTKRQHAKRMGVRDAARAALRPSMIQGWFDPSTRAFYLKWLRLRLGRTRRQATVSRPPIPDAIGDIRTLLERGVSVLLLYGEQDWAAATAETTGFDPLTRTVEQHPGLAQLTTIPGDLHGFPDVEVQQRTNEVVYDWLENLADAGDGREGRGEASEWVEAQ